MPEVWKNGQTHRWSLTAIRRSAQRYVRRRPSARLLHAGVAPSHVRPPSDVVECFAGGPARDPGIPPVQTAQPRTSSMRLARSRLVHIALLALGLVAAVRSARAQDVAPQSA